METTQHQVSQIGPYRLVGQLGRGGMGLVSRAVHTESGLEVAVKTLTAPSEAHLATIRREIHALASLQHPGIVRIVDSGTHSGMPWYAMELIEGPALGQWCADLRAGAGGQLGVNELQTVLSVLRRLCETLAYLHGEGLIHRDLKPDNILVRPGGLPVLVDFGVVGEFAGALSRERLHVDGGAAGTLLYMAPEQIRGELADARADLYSLGCILFECLGGAPPFAGSAWAVRRAHLEQPPPELPQQPFSGHHILDVLLKRLMAKEPRRRIGYATDVAASLAALGAENGFGRTAGAPRAYLYRPSFAGRERYLAELERHLSGLREGRGGLILLGGESGVGKTRLAMELGRTARARHARVLTGECLPSGGLEGQAVEPLGALRRPLQAIADRCRERGPLETERLLGAHGPVLAACEPAFDGVPGRERWRKLSELPPEAERQRLFTALTETLAALTLGTGTRRDETVLLVLDDLQWADDLTLGWLESLVSNGVLWRRPILVVATYRTEDVGVQRTAPIHRLLEDRRVQRVVVERLEESAVATIVGDMLALAAAPRRLSHYLSRQSEGNPYFVAEYLRAAVEEGLLWRDDVGVWQVVESTAVEALEADYEALELPRSLRELVGMRLARLPRDARNLAEAAATLGREVEEVLLAKMTRLGGAATMEAIDELLARQLLEETEIGKLRFVHDQIREAAYELIPEVDRRELHRRAAEAMDTQPEPEREKHMVALGRHWELAEEFDKARGCYLSAARHLRNRFSGREAVRLYRAFLALSGRPTRDALEARDELGQLLFAQGHNNEALIEFEAALIEALSAEALGGDLTVNEVTRAEARSLHSLGRFYGAVGKVNEGRTFLERALALHRQLGDGPAEADTLREVAWLRFQQGHTEPAMSLYQRALELHRELGQRRGEGMTLSQLGVLVRQAGRIDESEELLAEALRIHRQVGNRTEEGNTLFYMANLHFAQGNIDLARELFETSIRILREVGDRRQEGKAISNLANLERDVGHRVEARKLYELALELHREVGNRQFEGVTLTNLAGLERIEGDLSSAREVQLQALAIHREIGHRRFEGVSLTHLASVQRDRGEMEESRSLFEQALAVFREVDHRANLAETLVSLATLERVTGRPDRARELLDEADPILLEVHSTLYRAFSLCERGNLAHARGESVKPWLAAARILAAQLAAGPESELGQSLAELERLARTSGEDQPAPAQNRTVSSP